MRSRAVFINLASLDGVNISSTAPAVGDFTIDNLVTPVIDAIYKSSTNSATITIDLSRDDEVGFFALWDHNLLVGSTIDYQVISAGEVLEQGQVDAHSPIYGPYEKPPYSTRPYGYPNGDATDALWFNTAHFLEQKYIADSLVLTISAPQNTEIRAGYLIVGSDFADRSFLHYGSSAGFDVDSSIHKTKGGGVFAGYEPPSRTGQLNCNDMSANQASRFNRMVKYLQQSQTPFFVSFFDGLQGGVRQQHEVLAYVTSVRGPVMNQSNRFDATVSYIEATPDE